MSGHRKYMRGCVVEGERRGHQVVPPGGNCRVPRAKHAER
jgi:hypothetical protein